ncbi:MAG TPA: Flp family type IVb pilin [Streptosporangiaceae bacterium]|nr:Flp family type IVb pilin [Streptosporangiaceae bacterium]
MLMFLMNLQNFVSQRLRSERGATAVEYGLLVAVIAIVVAAAAVPMSGAISTLFGNVTTHL